MSTFPGYRDSGNRIYFVSRRPIDCEERTTYSIQKGACEIKDALDHQPTESDLVEHLHKTIYHQTMDDWKNSTHAHSGEHAGPKRTICRSAKSWIHGGEDTAGSYNRDLCLVSKAMSLGWWNTDHGAVYRSRLGITPEAVINTGDERTPDHQSDTNIVELVPEFGNGRGVVTKGVVDTTHGHSTACSQEETRHHIYVGGRC